MRFPRLTGLLILVAFGCSKSNVTTTIAKRDDLSVSVTSGRLSVAGGKVTGTGLTFKVSGRNSKQVAWVCWSIWRDSNGNNRQDPGEEIDSDCCYEDKGEHSFKWVDLSFDYADRQEYKVSYSAWGDGLIQRTTSLGSLLK